MFDLNDPVIKNDIKAKLAKAVDDYISGVESVIHEDNIHYSQNTIVDMSLQEFIDNRGDKPILPSVVTKGNSNIRMEIGDSAVFSSEGEFKLVLKQFVSSDLKTKTVVSLTLFNKPTRIPFVTIDFLYPVLMRAKLGNPFGFYDPDKRHGDET